MASTNPQYLLQGVPSSSGEAAGNQWRVSPDDAEAFAFVSNSGSPKRKVILAVALLVIGTVLLFMGVGFYVQDRPGGIPLLVIGSLAFIPGFYMTRIAYLAWKGVRGFSFNSIPDV